MTKNSKAMRRVLCGVVSFLLSFFSCLFVMCLVFKFTVLSSSFLVGVEKRSDYAEALHSELKEQFVSYGSAGNVDESFFDSVFENIITPDRIDEDTKAVITDFYNGEVKDSIDTSDIQSELETRLLEYAAEKGFTERAPPWLCLSVLPRCLLTAARQGSQPRRHRATSARRNVSSGFRSNTADSAHPPLSAPPRRQGQA